MNKSDYDKYYKKGGTYVIPVELFNELYDELERLNNIINELENELYKFYAYEGYNDEQIKDKIKELKGSVSNE